MTDKPTTIVPELLLPTEQATELVTLLGIDPATPPADLPAAIVDAVRALAESEAGQAGNAEAVAASARRVGLETIDKGVLASLRADAADAEKLRAAAAEKELDEVLASAVGRGKIASSRREHWRTMLRRDPAALADLQSIPDNTIPLKALGHDTNADVADEPKWFR